ncbi:MAG: GTP cyclohydrolase II [Rhodospirillaceae bacterium]
MIKADSPEPTAILVRAAETVDVWPPFHFDEQRLSNLSLVVTGRRAAVLGFSDPDIEAVALHFDGPVTLEFFRRLVGPGAEEIPAPPPGVKAAAADPADAAAIRLMKIARLLPAVISVPIASSQIETWIKDAGRVCVSAGDVESYDVRLADDLRPISEARVPLRACEDTRIISFRPKDGGAEHLAIVIGSPDTEKPVLTRLHSECFTGDLLGSLRCDCGDQLQGAIEAIAKEGSGVLLYLAQEGRGIGLVNKLRAYALQDQGFDTIDANEQLGFDDDERLYLPAARMLRALQISKIRLLTNNPAKVGAMARHGIEVVARIPHVFPPNDHNRSYLQAKAKRSGHLF